MHALIIEDEHLIADAIAEALKGMGFTSFDFARTEMEAVDLAELRRPDVITTDVHLGQWRSDWSGAHHLRRAPD